MSEIVSSYTDPVPSSTAFNSSSRKAQFSQLNNFSFYDSFDESRIIYLVQFYFVIFKPQISVKDQLKIIRVDIHERKEF